MTGRRPSPGSLPLDYRPAPRPRTHLDDFGWLHPTWIAFYLWALLVASLVGAGLYEIRQTLTGLVGVF